MISIHDERVSAKSGIMSPLPKILTLNSQLSERELISGISLINSIKFTDQSDKRSNPTTPPMTPK